MSRVVVHIDRLVLRGVDPGDRGAVTAALQAELQRHLSEAGIARHIDPTHRHRLDAGRVPTDQGGLGSAAGAAIARTLTGGKRP